MELTIITPSIRPQFLSEVYKSINFDKITKWIIVYDTSKGAEFVPQFTDNPKILEMECKKPNVSGGTPRQEALKLINSGFVYFLDDDNIIHPEFWNIIENIEEDKFYTWNCQLLHTNEKLYGNQCKTNTIDTSQFLVPRKMIGNIIWENIYAADGKFIEEIYNKNRDSFYYVNRVAAYYNYLTRNPSNQSTVFTVKTPPPTVKTPLPTVKTPPQKNSLFEFLKKKN